jgi:hypothetical protein
MARPGLFSHRKFRQLARTLNDEALAVGTLECLWFAAAETCDPRIGDDRDVEIAARWKGTPGALVPALVAAGFLDREADAYVVHNYWDHAPEYVVKRRHREAQRRASTWRNGDAEPVEVSGQTSGQVSRQTAGQTAGQTSGQTDAVCPDKRTPTVQGSSGQFRAVQKTVPRAREQPLPPSRGGQGKPKHQPRTTGAWSCPHAPTCSSYTACIKRSLDEANARS